MRKASLTVAQLLDELENFHGRQEPSWPVDPYEFLIWWQCGYPASDAACAKGWNGLTTQIGTDADALLAAAPAHIADAIKAGGMVPELRTQRLKEIAFVVKNEFGGDLREALVGPLPQVRRILKKFPSIGDPGADRILLFAGIAPVAAVPSNVVHVLVRMLCGQESQNYVANYREARRAIVSGVPESFDARKRAYLLLKCHGQEICKRTKPKCGECPVSANCAFFRDQCRLRKGRR
jgi:endonuclease III